MAKARFVKISDHLKQTQAKTKTTIITVGNGHNFEHLNTGRHHIHIKAAILLQQKYRRMTNTFNFNVQASQEHMKPKKAEIQNALYTINWNQAPHQ